MSQAKFSALIDYEDRYVQPLIIDAFKSSLPASAYELTTLSSPHTFKKEVAQLQIRAYEAIDFEQGLKEPSSLFNAYIIRKALIRKHFLSNTIFAWVTKNPESPLRYHFKPAVDFELDYAEFLDDALVEAFELRAAFERNEDKEPHEREWWILKPGMSDRGQGIRLFSTEAELMSIFEGWEEQNPETDDDNDSENSESGEEVGGREGEEANQATGCQDADHIVTAHLRHFIAQPYIHLPLLIPGNPYNDRKFHIRTYVVAAGALEVYVYSNMLALFASEPYVPPWETDIDGDDANTEEVLRRMQNIHLTNTCVQTSNNALSHEESASGFTAMTDNDDNTNNNVFLLSSLPLPQSTHTSLQAQIHTTTAALFESALSNPTTFQPLPQSFEVFGVDFLVDSDYTVWLLEVNAFPDFAQTGAVLRDVVVKGLWGEVMQCVVKPHFGLGGRKEGSDRLVKVLERDLKRR